MISGTKWRTRAAVLELQSRLIQNENIGQNFINNQIGFSWEPPKRQKLLLQKEETIYFRSNKEWLLNVLQDRNSIVELGYKLYHIIIMVHIQGVSMKLPY